MALAPGGDGRADALVRRPPVAMIGTRGYCLRISATIAGVRAAPETFRKSTPASRRLWMSACSETTVNTIGISTVSLMARMASFWMKALHTTPKAP